MTVGSSAGRPSVEQLDDALLPSMVVVEGEFDVFHARKVAAHLAARIGFDRSAIHRLVTAVSELGNNLMDHAHGGGVVSLAPLLRDGKPGIEVVAEDDGPGIADVEMAMTDGFSTRRGLGGGLPGCRRLMDEFVIRSVIGQGTRVMARLWLRAPGRPISGRQVLDKSASDA